jgi:D-beta-D-heptose 7-phosphate kinase/D-beta-D-heptose 1-phosphate adenosyltransferase
VTRDLIHALTGRQVLIVGDVMLDEYIWGEVSRISPEAPVPIVKVQRRTFRPGGAANVASNVAALGGVPWLCGVVGDDDYARHLKTALIADHVLEHTSLIASDRPTTVKTRIVAHNQQMLRLDSEVTTDLSPEVEDIILDRAREQLTQTEVCVISDYAKGVMSGRVCQALIQMAAQRSVPVIVDPKGRDYGKYAGATVVTPNLNEALIALNRHDDRETLNLNSVAIDLTAGLGPINLLITLGAEGMYLYQPTMEPVHIPALARSVYDVSGAGDTVIAALALGWAAGASFAEAARLANLAASIVVGKIGTATVTQSELQAAITN